MNLWEYLDGRAERRIAWRMAKLGRESQFARIAPTDFRGWLGLGLFLQSTFLFVLLATIPELNENQGFLTLASAVIVTGWIGGAAAFAYSAGKNSAEKTEQVSAALRLAESTSPSQKPDIEVKPGERVVVEGDART